MQLPIPVPTPLKDFIFICSKKKETLSDIRRRMLLDFISLPLSELPIYALQMGRELIFHLPSTHPSIVDHILAQIRQLVDLAVVVRVLLDHLRVRVAQHER